jgi:hypothetical protein
VVAVVAGLTGVAMLVAPADTGRYFSWPIGPPPLAALVGAFYVAAAITFAIVALRADKAAARGASFAILGFTLPTLVATMAHRDLFDFGRWQALAWVALFAGSPLAFSLFLFLLRGETKSGGDPLPGLARSVVALLAILYTVLAAGLLLAPGRLEDASPFALPGLSGRFLGSWCAFLAVLATFVVGRNRADEASIPLLALLLWPVAAMVGAIRSFDELQPPLRRLTYFGAVAALAGLAAFASAAVGSERQGSGDDDEGAGRW